MSPRVTKISKVFKGILIEDSLENHLNKINVSICQLLFFLDISDIAKHVEKQYYTDKNWHFKYDVSAMIKFAIVKFFRQLPYKKIVLSEEEAWMLGFQDKDGKTLIPSGGTLHHFVKYRLNVEGINEVMMTVGQKISKLIDALNWILLRLRHHDMISLVISIRIMDVRWIKLTLL